MIKIIADTHVHTIASDHAFSTLEENVRHAAEIGLHALAITDHGPAMPDAPHLWYFYNLPQAIPRRLHGVTVLRGVEANIMDFDGSLDLEQETLDKLDWVIASHHSGLCPYGTEEQHTSSYIGAAKNPAVDVIGHSGLPEYKYDYAKAVPVFKEYGKIVEINQNSYVVRKRSIPNCIEIAKLCKKYEVPVIVNSDAHFSANIAQVGDALQMLEEIDFPEKLILNADVHRFDAYLKEKRGFSIL